jgi:hypothetical protein
VAARSFTPEEANALLPTVRPLVERLVAAKGSLDEAQERSDRVASRIAGNGGDLPPRDLAELRDELGRRAGVLAGIVGELQELGLLVKDLDVGLVDFPAVREGREVLLCWRLGEDAVAYWHGPEDGFAGRRPL